MFGNGFGWPHLLIILVVVIILFGAKRLPDAARGVGKSLRIFKSETKAMREESGQSDDSADTQAQSTSAPQAQPQPQQQLPQSNGTNGATAGTPSPEPRKNDVQA